MFARWSSSSSLSLPSTARLPAVMISPWRMATMSCSPSERSMATDAGKHSPPVVGIDLGTTNSCVAIMLPELGNEVRIIEDDHGNTVIPSQVAIIPMENHVGSAAAKLGADEKQRLILVGKEAERQGVHNPQNTFSGTKRLIGRKIDDEEVQAHAKTVAYAVVGNPRNNDAWVATTDGSLYSPSEIASHVLAHLRRTAENYLGMEVEDAVITVPAYFNDAQRQATIDAGRMAGLNVRRVINEPTAAAMAYGMGVGDNMTKTMSGGGWGDHYNHSSSNTDSWDRRGEDGHVLVYDLGGGTLDVSVLSLTQGLHEVKASCGNTHLGGNDFDARLVKHIADGFARKAGFDIRQNRYAMQRIADAAQQVKVKLDSSLEAHINLPYLVGAHHYDDVVHRYEFNDMCKDLVEATIEPVRQCLRDAALSKNDIREVLVVGGMTRMPMVLERLQAEFDRPIRHTVDPDKSVAAGAAIQAAVLRGELDDVLLLDIVPLSLGIETMGGLFEKVIPRGSTVPHRASEVYTNGIDGLTKIDFKVYQGEREMAADNTLLADFQLTDLPPAPRGALQIQVTFDVDSNGVLNVHAKDRESGKQASVLVEAHSGLHEEEVQARLNEAIAAKKQDRKARMWAEARMNADNTLRQTKVQIEMYGSALTEPQRDILRDNVIRTQLLYDSGDAVTLKELSKATADLQTLSSEVYDWLAANKKERGQ